MASLALCTTNGEPVELVDVRAVQDDAHHVLLAGGDHHLAVGQRTAQAVGSGRADGDGVAVDLHGVRRRSGGHSAGAVRQGHGYFGRRVPGEVVGVVVGVRGEGVQGDGLWAVPDDAKCQTWRCR